MALEVTLKCLRLDLQDQDLDKCEKMFVYVSLSNFLQQRVPAGPVRVQAECDWQEL